MAPHLIISAIALLALGGCESAHLDIPAPWEPAEGRGAEVPIANLRPAPPAWTRVGSSIRGKPIEAMTLGGGPYRIYIIGGISGDEPEGPGAAEALARELLNTLPDQATVRIVRDMNPDGSAHRSRTNTRNVDLTRNWPSRDHVSGLKHGLRPASELETTAIQKDMTEFKPSLVLVFRSSARGPIVAMDGPGPLLAAGFGSAARGVDPRWRAVPERKHTTPGSPESYIAGTLKTPVLTVEFQRGRDATTNAAAARAGIVALATKSAPANAATVAQQPPTP